MCGIPFSPVPSLRALLAQVSTLGDHRKLRATITTRQQQRVASCLQLGRERAQEGGGSCFRWCCFTAGVFCVGLFFIVLVLRLCTNLLLRRIQLFFVVNWYIVAVKAEEER